MDAASILTDSRWVPIKKLGEGGGGTVYLAVSTHLIRKFDLFGWKYVDFAARETPYGRGRPEISPEIRDSVPLLIEAILASVRRADGLAAVKIAHNADERFKREVVAMETYKHPNLIRIIDRDSRETPKWFACRFYARSVLADPENRSRFLGQPALALAALRPIAEGLAEVHKAGAIHRDVKPKNIFVADDGTLVLGDFGVILPSPDADPLTATNQDPAHSRDWVPDWVQFEPDYTATVDVFAWAKVLQFLISGTNVMASQIDDRLAAIRKSYPDARGLAPILGLLKRCIVSRKKEVTIRTGAALMDEIDAILTGGEAHLRGAPSGKLLHAIDQLERIVGKIVSPMAVRGGWWVDDRKADRVRSALTSLAEMLGKPANKRNEYLERDEFKDLLEDALRRISDQPNPRRQFWLLSTLSKILSQPKDHPRNRLLLRLVDDLSDDATRLLGSLLILPRFGGRFHYAA